MRNHPKSESELALPRVHTQTPVSAKEAEEAQTLMRARELREEADKLEASLNADANAKLDADLPTPTSIVVPALAQSNI